MEAYVQMPLETYDVLKNNNEYLKRKLKEEQEQHSEDIAQINEAILISSTGKHKEDYIGQIGKICKVQHLYDKTTHWIDLFDIEFDDGAMFCVDREQIEFIEVDQ